jgi:mono/diheme cytochrome c family protein
MKNGMKVLFGIAIMFMAVVMMSFVQQGKKPWSVPDSYQKMKNPQAVSNAEMVNLGKTLYAKHCKACHGNFGKGDGPKAKSMKTPLDDFSTAAFQGQKDGVIYYQSYVGRDEMPNFEKKIIDEEERWAIVTYIRTLKK